MLKVGKATGGRLTTAQRLEDLDIGGRGLEAVMLVEPLTLILIQRAEDLGSEGLERLYLQCIVAGS